MHILSQEKINTKYFIYVILWYNAKLCQQPIKVLFCLPGFIKLVSKAKKDKYTGIELTV